MIRFILSGSTASAVERHCPHMIDFREAKEQEDTNIFETGTAAHAVLEAAHFLARTTGRSEIPLATLEDQADQVVQRLTATSGRDRHPLSITRALEGRTLAIRYLRQQSLDGMVALNPEEIPEQQITVDENWKVVAPDSVTAAFSGRFDLLHPPHEETLDDGSVVTVATLTDYKSAWPTNASELQSWQFIEYTCLIAALYPNVAAIRRVVVNLRTSASYDDLMWLDDVGNAKIRQWRRDLAVIRASVAKAPRPALPGGCCRGCPYVTRCDAAMRPPVDASPEAMVTALVALGARYDALKASIAPALKEIGSVQIRGGAYGYHEVQESEPVDGIAAELVGVLTSTSADVAREKHATACMVVSAMKPGSSNVTAALKRAMPSRSDSKLRKAEEARLLPKKPRIKCEFFKVGEAETDEPEASE
jgi:hypothetical protein